jgi:hypothetical protein
VCKKLPPRPLRGRGGAVTACEDHFLNAGYEETSAVISKVFGLPYHLGPASRILHEDPDAESYSEKLSRWIKATVHAINDKQFWIHLHIASISRRPIVHLQHWLQKHCNAQPEVHNVPTTCSFVWFLADRIAEEYDALFSDASNHSEDGWLPVWSLISGHHMFSLRFLVCTVTMSRCRIHIHIYLVSCNTPYLKVRCEMQQWSESEPCVRPFTSSALAYTIRNDSFACPCLYIR